MAKKMPKGSKAGFSPGLPGSPGAKMKPVDQKSPSLSSNKPLKPRKGAKRIGY